MSEKNEMLGMEIHKVLHTLGIESPINFKLVHMNNAAVIEQKFSHIMEYMGLDLDDDSLKQSPHRVAKMYCQEVFYGLNYANFPSCTTVENKMHVDEMVAVKCTVKSICEHHFVPFIGLAHVAYIPNNKLLGLSKFNRIVDFFSRRPQIQERLTEQVAATLCHILDTQDVAVVIQAQHFCVALRGVQDHVSTTTTSKLSGKFRTVDSLRAEFLSLTRTP